MKKYYILMINIFVYGYVNFMLVLVEKFCEKGYCVMYVMIEEFVFVV